MNMPLATRPLSLLILFLSIVTASNLRAQSARKFAAATEKPTIADSALYWRQMNNKDFFSRVSQFTELSWVSPPFADLGSPKKAYIVSADIQSHFFIGGERLPFVIDFVYRSKVRIFRNSEKFGDSSLAVRTPSYMPGLIFSIPLRHTPFDVYKNVPYATIAGFHHSNGQDGHTFSAPDVFNLYNGNFSTNFIELAYNWNRRVKDLSPNPKFNCSADPGDCNQCKPLYDRGYSDYIYKIGVEQHFATADDQKGSYGRTRVNLKAGYVRVKNWRGGVRQKSSQLFKQIGDCYLKELVRVIANASINVDRLDAPYGDISRRVNFDVGVFKRIAAGNTSVFAMGGYYGNDPYNIYYSQKYFFFRVGLALGFFVNTSRLRD